MFYLFADMQHSPSLNELLIKKAILHICYSLEDVWVWSRDSHNLNFLVNFYTPVDVKLGSQSEKCYDRVCPVCYSWNDTSREVVWCCRDDTALATPNPNLCGMYTYIWHWMWKGNATHFTVFRFFSFALASSDFKRWHLHEVTVLYSRRKLLL